MSQLIEEMPSEVNERNNEFDYRPMPPLAAGTAVLGVISLLAVITEFALPFAVFGIVLGVLATRQIGRSNGEYSGTWLVRTGMVLCVLCLFCGSAFHAYVYATEVPDGFKRLNFIRDISRKGFAVIDGRQDYHPDVKALDGQQIFLKGYMYPTNQIEGISQFILCKDSGECCFGGKPALTDMIYIQFSEGLTDVSYDDRLVSVAGKLNLGDLRRAGELRPAYMIEATHFEVARKLY